MNYKFSDSFIHTITKTHGDAGSRWLKQLPTIIEQCAQEWSLVDLTPYPNLTYNYVLAGKRNAEAIVLKLHCDHRSLKKEVTALEAFADYGGVKIVAHNQTLGAILLEQIIPGTPLSSLFPEDDARATRVASDLIQRLHQAAIPSSTKFPTLEQILPTFEKEPAALAPFIPQARLLRQQLLETSQQVLLHGDFHHNNILLSKDDTWHVIDPEGIIGDPYYDLAIFIRNPLKQLINRPDTKAIILNRITDFARLLGYDSQCIYDWTYLQAVISAYWSIEDGLDSTNHVTFLALLESVKKELKRN